MSLAPRLPAHAESTVHQFLRAHALPPRSEGVVIGLSGGIDSALVARLAVDALGADRVLGVLLPDRQFPPALVTETEEYARALGMATRLYPIDAIEDAVRALFPEVRDVATWGNVKSRARMIVLYTLAREQRRLVVGTGNKSELLLGYFTKYGDGGVDLLPIGDLYKTEVRALAHRLGLPRAILERAPTAGLWEGQTDEAELGAPYADLDRVLRGLEELRSTLEIARATGFPEAEVARIEARVAAHRHKRRPPPIPKIGLRTLGIDWRD